jgi:hypothetical protein
VNSNGPSKKFVLGISFTLLFHPFLEVFDDRQ